MIRILFITNMYPSKRYPSYGIFVKKTEDILKKENDVKTISIVKHTNRFIKLFAYIFFLFKIIFLGCVKRHDLVYSNFASYTSFPVRFLKRLRPSLKIVTNVHGNDVVPLNKKDAHLLSQTRRLLRVSDLVIVPSGYFLDIVKHNFDISESRIFIFPSGGIDTDNFKKISKLVAKKSVGLDAANHYIGFVSRIDAKKGWDTFLYAASIIHGKGILENYKYVVAGYGGEYDQMKALVRELGLDKAVTLIKDVDHSNLPYFYNSFDIFVFASSMPSESLGLVGLEAMACKQVVVAPDKFGPSTYVIDGVNGYTFRTGDYNSLAETIMKALKVGNSSRESLCNNARKTAMRYNESAVAEELLNAIRGLVKDEERVR